MSSDIGVLVDYTAARVGSQVTGIQAVYGSGTGNIDDPLRSGNKIQPAPFAPVQPFEHWSEVAAMTNFEWLTQDGGGSATWEIAMRCYLLAADFQNLRQQAQPLFALYLSAFQSDPTLGGHCKPFLPSRLTTMQLGIDPPVKDRARWGWIEVRLQVTEVVDP